MGMEATIMRKLLINLVMLILAFTIQICVFPQIAFLSSAPNLLLIVVFVCSFIEGRERGMFYGLVAGLFMDLFYSGPFGFYTLFFINLGYVSGICNKYYYEDYITLPLLLSLASDLIYNLYIYVFRFLIRNRLNFGHYLVSIIIPEIIFTTVTTLVVYRFFLFINRKLKEWEQRRDSNIVFCPGGCVLPDVVRIGDAVVQPADHQGRRVSGCIYSDDGKSHKDCQHAG